MNGDILGTGGYVPSSGLQPKKAVKKKKNFLQDQISTGGSLAGALGGGAVGTAILPGIGTLVGALLGGAAGGAGGQVAENAIVGDSLNNDVASEALWGGVTALPFGAATKIGKAGLTLAKGLGGESSRAAAKGLLNEAGVKTMTPGAVKKLTLSDALKDAPAQAAAERLSLQPSLSQRLGGKLSGAADDLAVKQFRLTPTQLTNFKTKFGEDAGQTIRKYGFTSADDVTTKGINPLQEQFDTLVKNAGDISKEALQKNFSDTVAKLKGANSTTNQQIGISLENEVSNLLAKYGDTIPANKINDIRREFDSLVNYTNKAADPNKYGVNKRVADVLRKTLQDADSTGKLKDVGNEISKLRQLSDNVAKQGELGRGSLPMGLIQVLSSGAGGVVGGVPGALGGAAMAAAVNSGAGRRALMTAVDKGVTKLSSEAPKGIGQSLRQAAARVGGIGATRALTSPEDQSLSDLNSAGNNTNAQNITTAPAINPMMTSNMDSSYAQSQEASNPLGYSSAQIGQALMAAYADGNSTAAKQLEGMYQLATEFEQAQMKASESPKLSAESSKVIANANSGLQSLDALESMLAQSPDVLSKTAVPGRDAFGGALGNALGTAGYDNLSRNVLDVITRLRTGAALTAGEEKFYRSQLPQAFDSPDVVRQKLGMFRELFSSVANRTGGSADASSLASALQSGAI